MRLSDLIGEGFLSGASGKGPNERDAQGTRVRTLGWKDPLEEGMAIYSSILAWKIPRTEEPGGVQSIGPQRVRHD